MPNPSIASLMLLLATLANVSRTADAQPPAPGDLIVADQTIGIGIVDRATGVLRTLVAGPNLLDIDVAPGNASLRALRVDGTILDVAPGGAASTVAVVPGTVFGPVGSILDQDGTSIVARQNVLYRQSGASVATLATSSGFGVNALTMDTDTGDYVVAQTRVLFSELLRIDRRTLAPTTIAIFPSTPVFDVEHDQRTGHYWVAAAFTSGGGLQLLHRSTGATLASSPGPAQALAIDQITSHVFYGSSGVATNRIIEIDATGATVRTLPLPSPWKANGLAIWGSRKATGNGSGAPGSTFAATLSFPSSPNRVYCAAVSFSGLRPGIPFAGGTIHVVPDALFFLTACGRLPGLTTGFAGVLDATGAATARWTILPGVPRGIRYRFSASALNPTMPGGIDTAPILTVVVE